MEESTPIEPTKKRTFKKLKRAIVVLSLLVLAIIITGVVLANIYEKEIKKYALEEINSHLKAQLKIDEDDISFSFFKKFPKASLNFSNVLIEDENKTDTILFAENFSLEFGLGSLLSGNYEVSELDLDNATINLLVDTRGKENYIFWKESEETDTSANAIGFKLKEVNLNQVFIHYANQVNKYKADIRLDETVFSGDFSTDTSKLSISSSHYIQELSEDSTFYFQGKESSLSVKEGIFHPDLIVIDEGTLSVEEMTLDLTCNFDLKKENSRVHAKASNVEISDVFSLMPQQVRGKLQEYSTKGKVNGNLEILTKKREKSPKIEVDFLVENGSVTEKNSGVTLSQLALKGNYHSNIATQKLELISGQGRLKGGQFSMNGKIIGKHAQTILSTIRGEFDLEELSAFLNLDGIDKMSGSLTLNNQFRGTARSNGSVSVSEFTGTAKLTDANLKLRGREGEFTDFSGDIRFNRFNSNASFSGYYGESDISLNTQFSNFIPYLFYNQELKANVYLQSQKLELDKLIGNEEENIEKGEDTTGVSLPNRITANLRTNIAKLTYQKHQLTNLSGAVTIKHNKIQTNNLVFDANQGKYHLKGMLRKESQSFYLTSDIVCGQIEISDLLHRFNNFGQTVLRSEHLNGKANAIINISSKTNKHLEIDMNSLEANTEFSVSGGVLKNLELFDEIGEYLKGNVISRSVVKVDELSKKLKRVEFSEFTNTIKIKNKVITIPSMMLKTSAMDIGIYGTQTFDYQINYGMNLRLKDILTKKKDNEYGYIVDEGDGARLFLLMTGTIDEPIFKLDKAGRKEYQQKQREAEKNNVKSILKDEFGLFKKDTSIKQTKEKPKPKPKFEIDWEEEKKEPSKQGEKKEKEEPKKKKKNKWLEKLKGKEEKKDKVEFEVE